MARKPDTAAKKARGRLKERLAERRQQEQLNENDLVAFFELTEATENATEIRAKAVAAAAAAYEKTVADAEEGKARRLYAIKERGETIEGLAALTELSEMQVRTLLRRGKKLADADAAQTPDGDTADPQPGEASVADSAAATPTNDAADSAAAEADATAAAVAVS